MKQAKIMLAAIALFGVVGASLAFKAQKGALTFYTPDPNNTTICDQTLNTIGILTTDQSAASIIATLDEGSKCFTALYYTTEQ